MKNTTSMTFRQNITSLTITGMLWALPLVCAQSAVIYTADGFENPPFSLGTISGQDGWSTVLGNSADMTIQSGTVFAGTQALRIASTPTVRNLARFTLGTAQTEDFWSDVQILPPDVADIQGNFTMRVRDSGGAVQSSVIFNGGGGISGTSGSYNQGAWNRVSLFFDFDGGGNKYFIYLNESLLTPTGISFAGINLRAFEFDWTADATAPTSGGGYVDNFVLQTTSPIPEPTSIALLAISGFLIGMSRRKRIGL